MDKEKINSEDMAEGKSGEIKKEKISDRTEMILLFILAILVGIAIKTEAAKKITIGYEDYKLPISRQNYDVNALQKDLVQKAAAESEQQPEPESAPENQADSQPETENVQPE